MKTKSIISARDTLQSDCNLCYNTHGYLASIAAGGATRFTITEMDARQQIKEATYGTSLNGSWDYDDYGYPSYTKAQVSGTYRQDYRYSFDPVTGNLNSRQNYLYSKSESFTYDNLDRLKTVSGPQNLTMNYYPHGNISTKSDLSNTYEYNHPTKPYALTGLSTTGNLIPETEQFAFYTSFEQVSFIAEGEHYASFVYNADDQRCKMEVEDGYGLILTRWYVGSRYMKETAGASTKEYTWIGGDAYTAPVVAVKIGSTTNWYYALRDYLGTITHLVWSTNNVAGEYTFDAWGRRRDKDDWSYNLVAEPELFAGRGFTGHEWLPWFNLYNMNGRLYDPVVGRFLSPDNYVQDPFSSQNYNRYSYVLNNPLKYTDPDGESFLLALATVIVGNYVIGWLDNVINKGMSPKEAFKNTNFIMGVDFNPGDMSKQNNYGFSNPQVDAHNEPKKEQERTKQVNKKLDDVRQAYGQAWQEASSVGLLPPVNINFPITSPYNEGNRVIPELGLNRPHLAIDIGTPVGTPVLSPWSGIVMVAQDTEYGLSVIVKHDYYHDNNLIQTGYAHLSKINNISKGSQIQRGDTIGFTGTWGTGPHLHFTLRIGERKVNPTILFPYY